MWTLSGLFTPLTEYRWVEWVILGSGKHWWTSFTMFWHFKVQTTNRLLKIIISCRRTKKIQLLWVVSESKVKPQMIASSRFLLMGRIFCITACNYWLFPLSRWIDWLFKAKDDVLKCLVFCPQPQDIQLSSPHLRSWNQMNFYCLSWRKLLKNTSENLFTHVNTTTQAQDRHFGCVHQQRHQRAEWVSCGFRSVGR